jgi:hypothetical protein
VEKVVGVAVLGAIPIGSESTSGTRSQWGLPAWVEPGFLLTFVVGIVIGAGLGALIVGLL